MSVKWRTMSPALLVIAILILQVGSSASVASGPRSPTEHRLRERIAQLWPNLLRGDFDAYVAMWSARKQPEFRGSGQDLEQELRYLKLLPSMKPTFKLLDLQITGLRARAKMQLSLLDLLEPDGSRYEEIRYDYYWVFENGDWFLDDAVPSE